MFKEFNHFESKNSKFTLQILKLIMSKTSGFLLIIVSILLLPIQSCNKNTNRVPYVPVDLYLNISLPAYINLNANGGWVYVSGGSKGLIVYRQTTDLFLAYDRHCTYDVNANCSAAAVDSTNVVINCDCDGSQYQIFDGSVIQGPALAPLQQYQTSFDLLSNTLHIYN